MRDIKKLEDWADTRLWRGVSKTEREILINYKAALDDIRVQLSKVYEKYAQEGILTHAEMTKYNRLKNLNDELVGIMGPTLSKNGRLVEKLAETQYEQSFFLHAWTIDQASGVALRWGGLSTAAIKAAVDNDLRKIAKEGILKDGLLGIRRTVTQGLIQGQSYAKMAKNMKGFIERSASGYVRIARTEAHRAQVQGQLDNYAKAEELGIEMQRVWNASLDARTRPTHAQMDGKTADESGIFHTPWGPVTGPGQEGPPEEVINCLPGWAVVTNHTGIEKIYRRWYEGKLITVLAGGLPMFFTGTPNHPILTDHGWVPLNKLNRGMKIVCNRFAKQTTISNYNIDYKPTMISEIFNFAMLKWSRHRMRGIDSQFHGDGRNGYVDIIDVNCFLPKAFMSTFGKPRYQFGFSETSAGFCLFKRDGFFYTTIQWLMCTAKRIISRFSKYFAFGIGSLGHTRKHGFAAISLSESSLREKAQQNGTADIQFGGQSFDGFTGEMFLNEIVDVVEHDFSGHVYNLQCEDGIYAASIPGDSSNRQGVVTHNCRCRVTGLVDGYGPKVRRVKDEGVVPYVTYDKWAKEHNL